MIKYLLIVFVLLIIWSFFIEPNLLVVKRYSAPELGNTKIVFASDFHISKHDKHRLNRIVNLINKHSPDLVLFGGDFIKGHDGKNTLSIEEQAEVFSKINAPIISVLGNHDGWYDKSRVANALEKNGIVVLSNSSKKINGIYVSGVEDIQTGYPDIELALSGTERPRILLTHSPDIYYDVKESVDLILAGHVHGGQVYIPFLGAPTVPSIYGSKFARGVIFETKNKMIITKGLGTSILPIRFFSVPEIILIN